MTLFAYLFITFALTIQFNTSSSISSSDDEPVTNKSIIELSKHRSKRYSPDFVDRIIGGQFVKDSRMYPFMVMLHSITWISPNENDNGLCGGTLLSNTHVLTAAHCFKECHCNTIIDDDNCFNCTIHKKEDYTLHFGNIVHANSKISRKIKTLHIHPKYKKEDRSHKCIFRFDMAVLELSTPVPTSERISPIKLPEPVTLDNDKLSSTMTSSFFDTNNNCKLLGWGKIGIEDKRKFKTRHLKVASVPLIGHKKCINFLFNIIKLNGNFYPGYEQIYPTEALCIDTSICSKCPLNRMASFKGDSGGPIICGGVQVGVINWHCAELKGSNLVNIHSRVDINVQWIRSIMSMDNKHDRIQYEY